MTLLHHDMPIIMQPMHCCFALYLFFKKNVFTEEGLASFFKRSPSGNILPTLLPTQCLAAFYLLPISKVGLSSFKRLII